MKSVFFTSPIYVEEDIYWLDSLNNFSDKYINEAIENNKKNFINNKDFGLVHHSVSLTNDINFLKFMQFISKRAYSILDEQGYDLKDYSLVIKELWVQEFSKEGGGHHSTHTHWDGHISGFYFLKCSNKTSYPIFHDPRPGKIMIQLPEKDITKITDASEKIPFKPKPGIFVFFNSYLGHEFVVDHGIDSFRFIHFNIQAVPKQLINNDIKRISS
jgi:uncharacterized protein (TIGR02466 family)